MILLESFRSPNARSPRASLSSRGGSACGLSTAASTRRENVTASWAVAGRPGSGLGSRSCLMLSILSTMACAADLQPKRPVLSRMRTTHARVCERGIFELHARGYTSEPPARTGPEPAPESKPSGRGVDPERPIPPGSRTRRSDARDRHHAVHLAQRFQHALELRQRA